MTSYDEIHFGVMNCSQKKRGTRLRKTRETKDYCFDKKFAVLRKWLRDKSTLELADRLNRVKFVEAWKLELTRTSNRVSQTIILTYFANVVSHQLLSVSRKRPSRCLRRFIVSSLFFIVSSLFFIDKFYEIHCFFSDSF